MHGYSRTTGDMDILVNKTAENYSRLANALYDFRMPVFDMTRDNFLLNSALKVFTFGRQPVAIDIMTAIKGAGFNEIFEDPVEFEVDNIKVRTISRNKLIEVKKASGRPKDLDDIDNIGK